MQHEPGLTRNDVLLAVKHEGRSYCGAAVGEVCTSMTDGHYTFEDAYRWDINVLTHTAPACPFRAPAFPANAFALEQVVDSVAGKWGVDPLLMRIYQETDPRRAAVYRLAREKLRHAAAAGAGVDALSS